MIPIPRRGALESSLPSGPVSPGDVTLAMTTATRTAASANPPRYCQLSVSDVVVQMYAESARGRDRTNVQHPAVGMHHVPLASGEEDGEHRADEQRLRTRVGPVVHARDGSCPGR